MAGKAGYALDLLSPVRHVATELDRASAALSDLAAGYRHPNTGDLARVKMHEGCETDHDAVLWLIDRAISELKTQVTSDGNGGYMLAKPFDDLRYKQRKLVRLVETDDADEKRALKAVYNDLTEDRSFYVIVMGERGGKKEQRYKLHPLARAIPQIPEDDFLEMAADVKTHGVKLPIVVFNGDVLDGRHRVAIASALKVPLRISEFKGTDEEARDHVLSLNVHRRHLTMAQRGLIVRELFLPEAKAEAAERLAEGQKKGGQVHASSTAEVRESKSGPTAAQVAADRSNGLANVRTVETMAPVDDAPKTKERIRRGEVKTAAAARREALKETGSAEPEKIGAVQSLSAWTHLGQAKGKAQKAYEVMASGDTGDITNDQIRERTGEIRAVLDRIDGMLT